MKHPHTALKRNNHRRVPLHPKMLKQNSPFLEAFSKPHLNPCCVILHAYFEIRLNWRIFTRYCLFTLSGAHMFYIAMISFSEGATSTNSFVANKNWECLCLLKFILPPNSCLFLCSRAFATTRNDFCLWRWSVCPFVDPQGLPTIPRSFQLT